MGRIYIILQEKKGGRGVINGAYARISSTDNPRQSKGYSPSGIKSLTNCTVINLVAMHSMVQNWLMRYRIVINSINVGIKRNALLLGVVCARAYNMVLTTLMPP